MSEPVLYKKMYFEIFNAVTDAVSLLDIARSELFGATGAQKLTKEEQIELAIISLRKAQQRTEQIYIDG